MEILWFFGGMKMKILVMLVWKHEDVSIDVIISLSVKEPIGKNDLASWPAGHVFPTMVHCLDNDDKF